MPYKTQRAVNLLIHRLATLLPTSRLETIQTILFISSPEGEKCFSVCLFSLISEFIVEFLGKSCYRLIHQTQTHV